MAVSVSTQEGQFPKVCELCEGEIKINWKCMNCNLLMCTKCKEKVHSKFQSADKHKIIDVKDVGKHSQELDLSTCNIYCEGHKGQSCVMFCKSCNQLVCPQCIAEVHNFHGLVQIGEGFKLQVKNLKELQQQVKSHLEELTNGESKIKLLREDESSKYIETRNLMQAQNAALKREVDKYTEKLIKELDQKWETLKNSIDKEEHKVTAMKTRKVDQSKQVEDIINSNDAEQVFKNSKLMGIFTQETIKPVKLDFTTLPEFIPGEITENNFGLLQDIPEDLIRNIYLQFRTDITNVFYLSTCHDNSLWISDDKVIQRVKPEGSHLKVMSNFNMKIYGMAVTPSNDLLLVAKGSWLKQISGSSGRIIDSVYSADTSIISAVHVTGDYKVLVGAGDYTREVVIRMNRAGKHEKIYENDRNKQPLFTDVRHITTTTNGTIFVVDDISYDGSGRVVVLGQDDVINIYTGHPEINSDDKPFKPICVVTTPSDNIIVTELDIPCTLHILNSVGHLITCYNTDNAGILYPRSLSFTTSGQLYIGCTRAAGSKDKAKLYKVDISQI